MAGDPPEGCGCTSTISRVLIAGHDRFPTYYGTEFVSRALDQWAYLHQVTLDFQPLGKTDRQTTRWSNLSTGRLRDECLNTNWFLSLDDARRKIEAWREHYNQSRPHASLGYVPPSIFAQEAAGNGGP
jgi:putative transposase